MVIHKEQKVISSAASHSQLWFWKLFVVAKWSEM